MTSPTPATTTPKLTLAEMRKFDGTLYAKNHSRHTLSCNTDKVRFMLQAQGTDGDVQVVPKECFDVAGFQKVIAKGQISISPDYEEEAIRGSLAVDEEREARMAEINATLEESGESKDLIQAKCLVSGEMIFQTAQDVKNLVPPLSPQYKDRAHEFIPTEVPGENGETSVIFSRVQIG